MAHAPFNNTVVDQSDCLNSDRSQPNTAARISISKRLINAAKRFLEVDEKTAETLSDYCG